MKTVGIVGYGSFGKFLVHWLKEDFNLRIFEPNQNIPITLKADIQTVATCDYVILAVPLNAYKDVCSSLKAFLKPHTVIVDIASVKQLPIKLIKKYLPGQPYVALHPLFGPESAATSLKGHTVVLCEASDEKLIGKVKTFVTERALDVVHMSAREHDEQMAVVQGLTFFLAHTLNEFGLHEMKLKTPSFQKLLDLAELDNHHSIELLKTILVGNGEAKKIRKNYIKALQKFNKLLK